jgi:hypothetical protein
LKERKNNEKRDNIKVNKRAKNEWKVKGVEERKM